MVDNIAILQNYSNHITILTKYFFTVSRELRAVAMSDGVME